MGLDASDLPFDVKALSQAGDAAPSGLFDKYRSQTDPHLTIFVAKDAVPPFRFKAGGWELLQSSIELGLAMKARVVEQGFLMCRVNEDLSGWTELTDLPAAFSPATR